MTSYVYQACMAEVAMFAQHHHRCCHHCRHWRQYAPASYTMLTIKKRNTWVSFNFYAWFSSVSPISVGMELRSLALRAGKAPLLFTWVKRATVKVHCYFQEHNAVHWPGLGGFRRRPRGPRSTLFCSFKKVL